jgi:hypothetical protein
MQYLLFGLENGGSTFLRNVGELVSDYMMSHPSRQYFAIMFYVFLAVFMKWVHIGLVVYHYV